MFKGGMKHCLHCGITEDLTKHHIFRCRKETIWLCGVCHRMVHTAELAEPKKLRRVDKRDKFLIRLGLLIKNEPRVWDHLEKVREIKAIEKLKPPVFEPDPEVPYAEQKKRIMREVRDLGKTMADDWQRGWWYRHLAALKEWGSKRHVTLVLTDPDELLQRMYAACHDVFHRVGWENIKNEETVVLDDVRSYLQGKGIYTRGRDK